MNAAATANPTATPRRPAGAAELPIATTDSPSAISTNRAKRSARCGASKCMPRRRRRSTPYGHDASMAARARAPPGVLVVHDLPDRDSPDGPWYVDAGLGDALHEPLPLVPGTYPQGPLRFELQATDDGVGDWHLTHDPRRLLPRHELPRRADGHRSCSPSATSGCRPRRSPASCGSPRPRPATRRASTSCAVACSRSSAARRPARRPPSSAGRLVRRPRGPAPAAARRRRRRARAPVGQGRGPARSAGRPRVWVTADRFLGKACTSGSGFRNLRCTPRDASGRRGRPARLSRWGSGGPPRPAGPATRRSADADVAQLDRAARDAAQHDAGRLR